MRRIIYDRSKAADFVKHVPVSRTHINDEGAISMSEAVQPQALDEGCEYRRSECCNK